MPPSTPTQTTMAQANTILTQLGKLLAAAEKTELKFKTVGLVREGTQIIIPPDMTIRESIIWLTRLEAEDELEVAVDEEVEAFPLEGAFAFAKAISRTYGFAGLVPTPGWFGMKIPPTLVSVEVGINQTEQVPWGRVEIPDIAGYLETGMCEKDGRWIFKISGVIQQKSKQAVKTLAALTRELVRTESIYRGHAIRVAFPAKAQSDDEEDEEFNPRECPKFVDTSAFRADELIFPNDVEQEVVTSLFTPIEHTQRCRNYEIPLKRGILLEGDYGVGKTLAANVAARKCVENGWTAIYINRAADLESAIHFARSYQPALIFAEDIDRAMEGERDEDMDAILNKIDGVDTKGMELIVCLTTNKVQNIEVSMLRPGRLDAVISIKPPDAEASLRLVRLYARGLLNDLDDFTAVGRKLAGNKPAVIREIVERSKLASIARLPPESPLQLSAADLAFAADQMANHLRLMTPKTVDDRPEIVKAADVLGKHVAGAMRPTNGHVDIREDDSKSTVATS
jgi:ATPase family protein associated with various cellular activities (AAA)